MISYYISAIYMISSDKVGQNGIWYAYMLLTEWKYILYINVKNITLLYFLLKRYNIVIFRMDFIVFEMDLLRLYVEIEIYYNNIEF